MLADPIRKPVGGLSPQDDLLAKGDVLANPLPVKRSLPANMQARYPPAQERQDPVPGWPVAP